MVEKRLITYCIYIYIHTNIPSYCDFTSWNAAPASSNFKRNRSPAIKDHLNHSIATPKKIEPVYHSRKNHRNSHPKRSQKNLQFITIQGAAGRSIQVSSAPVGPPDGSHPCGPAMEPRVWITHGCPWLPSVMKHGWKIPISSYFDGGFCRWKNQRTMAGSKWWTFRLAMVDCQRVDVRWKSSTGPFFAVRLLASKLLTWNVRRWLA